ncbi:MAG TPA: hypothetical protein VMH30_10125 [Verrucomicrobiae bacterium]|nr:hypothetical protein [Verrucomicrobiae bacterium]
MTKVIRSFKRNSLPATGNRMTIGEDYLAGTNPTNAASVLRITSGTFGGGDTNVSLTWNSVPTRFYYIQKSLNLSSNI